MKRQAIGFTCILLSVLVVTVSAFIYETATNTATQTIQQIATLTVNQPNLGNIEEGETIIYTATNTSILNDIISLTTTKANVYLHLNSDLEGQGVNYDTYTISVKIGDTLPGGSGYSIGDTVVQLKINSPDTVAGIDLDVAGDWTFDYEIEMTAYSVSSDQATTVTTIVSVENTNT